MDNQPHRFLWVMYTQVSAGLRHSVLLRSDGSAVAFGQWDHGACNVPALRDGTSYSQVSAGVRIMRSMAAMELEMAFHALTLIPVDIVSSVRFLIIMPR